MRWLVRFEKGGVPRTTDVVAGTAEEATAKSKLWFPDMDWVSTVPDSPTARYLANSERTGPKGVGG